MGFAARSAGAVLLLALGWPGFAVAAPFTIGFTGVVTVLENPLFVSALNSVGVSVGETITGSYTLESTTPDLYPGQDLLGSYEFAVLDVAVTIGDYELTYDPTASQEGGNLVNITNSYVGGPGSDVYFVSAPVFDAPEVGVPPLFFALLLADNEKEAFSTDAITLVPTDLPQFEDNFFILDDATAGSELLIIGTFTSIFLVPEPSSVLLLGAGLAALGWIKRRGAGR